MKRSKMSHYKKLGIKYLLLAIPFMLFFFAFSYVPLFGWGYAFFDYEVGHSFSNSEFVGFENFARLFKEGNEILRVLRNTLVMSALHILATPAPMLLAIMFNEIGHKKFKKFAQTVTTLPNFISWIVIFGFAFAIFSSSGSYYNFRDLLGFPAPKSTILGDVDNTWLFQFILSVWKSIGWGAIIYLAAITGIDQELYDAARVDGAGRFRLIIHITIPGLISTYLVMLLLSISNLLNSGFDQYYVFYNSLVSSKIEVLDYYIYKMGIILSEYSYAVVLGMLKTLIGIALLFTANKFSKKLRGDTLI